MWSGKYCIPTMGDDGCKLKVKAPSGGCVTINPSQQTGKCKEKLEGCQFDIQRYHSLCDKYWDLAKEELPLMELTDLEKAIENLEVCISIREKHLRECIAKECRDKGHSEAVDKLRRKVEMVKRFARGPKAALPDLQKGETNKYQKFITRFANNLETSLTIGPVEEFWMGDRRMDILASLPLAKDSALMEFGSSDDMEGLYKSLANRIVGTFAGEEYKREYRGMN